MGWIPERDEPTGVGFALPLPMTGPNERDQSGKDASVLERSYTSRAGDVTLSVEFLTTPDDPAALAGEVSVRRVPYRIVDELRSTGPVAVDVLSNRAVDGAEVPTYEARLLLTSDGEKGVWALRSRQLDDVVLVTQVVTLFEGDQEAAEAQVGRALARLDDSLSIPETLQ